MAEAKTFVTKRNKERASRVLDYLKTFTATEFAGKIGGDDFAHGIGACISGKKGLARELSLRGMKVSQQAASGAAKKIAPIPKKVAAARAGAKAPYVPPSRAIQGAG